MAALASWWATTSTYSPSGTWTRCHQLSLNGKRETFNHDDLMAVAPAADIRNPREIIEQVSQIVSQWKQYATTVEVPESFVSQISENLILF
jgi:serine/threonine-protein kinase HipA